MPIKLDTLAEEFDTGSDAAKAMLAKLQNNILKPSGRNFARHLFLQFTGSAKAAKDWIRDTVTPLIQSANEQFNPTDPEADGGLVAGFYLSASGYAMLGFSIRGFASEAFRAGMKDQGDSFFDRLLGIENKDPNLNTWEAWSRAEVHALVNLSEDDETKVIAGATKLALSSAGIAHVLWIQDGNVLRRALPGKDIDDGEPVEHFGYRDGISQPIFTKHEVEELRKQVPPFDTSKWDPAARLSLVLVDDPPSDEPDANGSYLVYRKLAQDLQRFDASVLALANSLGIHPDLAGACAVGRFKDGTPVVRHSAPGPGEENDFDFRHDDSDGAKCPVDAHIRKVNPRGTTPLTSLEGERRRRIARRGIPYGRPISPGVAEFPATDPDPNLPRGLLLQRETGDDPLIGQDSNAAQRWPNKWGDERAGTKSFNFDSAVTLRGGEYFFAPSLPFLKSL